ncbi:2OG-Fe(II) oxygenase [Baaleninema sp.]|uniref:2OG-Fe(II) oxygenase n=1 Tax=Baaleninema sp. TaxID=3101197 RepID=UPI003D053E70
MQSPPQTLLANNFQEAWQRLVSKSVRTLDEILDDTTLSVGDRAEIALQVIALHQQTGRESSLAETEAIAPSCQVKENVNRPNPKTHPLDGYVLLENFLSPEENQQALEIALTNRENFISSSTTNQATDYRRSLVLYATFYCEFYQLLKRRILQVLPEVCDRLDRVPFNVTELEMQLTAHNDGCYYKVHNDSGSPETATRELTYVYYFHCPPKAYSGGELRMYETDSTLGKVVEGDRFTPVEPQNNSIIFFDSRCQHEVRPVRCPSKQFEDSRFTLNGWLRR